MIRHILRWTIGFPVAAVYFICIAILTGGMWLFGMEEDYREGCETLKTIINSYLYG